MQRWAKIAAVMVAVTATTALAAKDSGPTATVTAYKGYDKGAGLGTGTVQFYYSAPTDACKGRKRITAFTWINGAEKVKQIQAGAPLVITAETVRYAATGVYSTGYGYVANMSSGHCFNRLRFTPQPGARYRLKQDVQVGVACTMSLVEDGGARDGQAPADLEVLPNTPCS